MAQIDWYRCRFLESIENLKPLVQKRFGREPSSSVAREIVSCLQQGRLFYEAAASSPLEIRPLQLFYGMVGFSKALVVARRLHSLSTLRPAHGLKDISTGNSRIADLRVKIENSGTFQEFNDVEAELTRVCYVDSSMRRRTVPLPSAKSGQLCGVELSLQGILSRIPALESLYEMTFGEQAATSWITLECAYQDTTGFRISIEDPQLFTDRDSLKQIVGRVRSKYPFLEVWRLHSAEHASEKSVLYFRNRTNLGIDEFSEMYLSYQNERFQESSTHGETGELVSIEQGVDPLAGGYTGGRTYAISPVCGFHISEFSLQYLGLFLLSSLVRYRPQTWTHAISGSIIPGERADDKTLSLIERFLDLNTIVIPEMLVRVLNPFEDERFA